MAEYIDREAAVCIALGAAALGNTAFSDRFEIAARLRAIPAADVRPVVLCRDCMWCHAGYCEKYDDLIPFGCANKPWDGWFCADGKKREES